MKKGVNSLKIRVFTDSRIAVAYAAAIVEHVVEAEHHPTLSLATGETPSALYAQLVEFHRRGLSFTDVTTVNLDEYVGLPKTHAQSYHQYMQEHFFQWIDISKDRIFIPNGYVNNLQNECERYDRILQQHPIDLQILGIGINGHIGFNEPGTAFKPTTHIVGLSEETIRSNARFFNSLNDVPKQAITMGLQPIMQSKQILLMAFGEQKAQAVHLALEGDVQTHVPASILQIHPNVTFILDEAVAKACKLNL
ncbi:glucosamine-6-phosphate deaminase [Alicyclobacillaceae bacterium I2511]|nr:glucosamine-6-phosphate deaminase [Alicyclobacillaceae bacterium I2511]